MASAGDRAADRRLHVNRTGATTRTPSASPTTYLGQTDRGFPPSKATVPIEPIVPPTNGATTTPQTRNGVRALSGVRSRGLDEKRRISTAPTSGSSTLPKVQKTIEPAEYPCSRSPLISARATPASTHGHLRWSTIRSNASDTPAAGQKPAPRDTGSFSQMTSWASARYSPPTMASRAGPGRDPRRSHAFVRRGRPPSSTLPATASVLGG